MKRVSTSLIGFAGLLTSVITVAGCAADNSDDTPIARAASSYMAAVASADCDAVSALTLPRSGIDPCQDLPNRAMRLSMLENPGNWKIVQENDRATAEIILGKGVPVRYDLRQVSGNWLVVYP